MSSPVSARVAAISTSPTLAVTAKAASLRAAGQPVIGFGAGEPDFPTPANIVAAAQLACADPSAHKYSATPGLGPLRDAIAAKAKADSGLAASPEQVVVANGGKQALYEVFATLLDPGDEVILAAPFWVSYPEQIAVAGGVPVVVSTDEASGFRASVEQLEEARTERTKALLFVSPCNPTGAVYDPEDVAMIGAWAASHGLWVITDEIYQHLVYGDATFASLPVVAPEAAERCVVVNGVAKTYAMTGWRVGWVIAPQDVAAGMTRLQSHLTSNVCNVAQAAALEALTGPQDAVAEMVEAFDRRRRIAVDMLRALSGVTCSEPEGAFYTFPGFHEVLGTEVRGRPVATTLDLADLLLDEAQVALVPGEAFGAPGHARISYALGEAELTEGIERIGSVLS
ncbi:MAG: pyridoxal phosphate-dependent aminotransferase [Actinobacteria bacterium]|nr:pyridoxal phosphate-dependent aminotransferase [Actinomycetota bacterium]